jgi:hypothetical protein
MVSEIAEVVRNAVRALDPLVDHKPSERDRRLFYEQLSVIGWLEPEVLNAINKAIDSSAADEVVRELSEDGRVEIVGRQRHTTRAKKEERQVAHAISRYWEVERRKADLKAQGVRGYHDRAYEEVAKRAHMSISALRQLIRRFLPEDERRRALKASAQQFVAEPKN